MARAFAAGLVRREPYLFGRTLLEDEMHQPQPAVDGITTINSVELLVVEFDILFTELSVNLFNFFVSLQLKRCYFHSTPCPAYISSAQVVPRIALNPFGIRPDIKHDKLSQAPSVSQQQRD